MTKNGYSTENIYNQLNHTKELSQDTLALGWKWQYGQNAFKLTSWGDFFKNVCIGYKGKA